MAAARGGYVNVCTMPNLNPVPSDLESLKIYVDNKDYKGIKAIAHKMTSMFAQINAKRESEILIYLNKVTNESISDLHSQIHKLEQLFNNECKPAIESYLKKIMQ